MATWGWVAAGYGAVLFVAALTQPIRRRVLVMTATLAYLLASLALAAVGTTFAVALVAPGALLLAGYWLSGFFFRDPQPWLEASLLRVDRAVAAERWMTRLPRVVQEVLELSYALVYAVVGGGALYAATFGLEAVTSYWNLVLLSELASYAPLPWLRSRPPRALVADLAQSTQEQRSAGARHLEVEQFANSTQRRHTGGARHRSAAETAPYLRRLNTAILDNASVQANTLPSGHVSGAVAAALAVGEIDPVTGAWLMLMAGLIAVAAVAGRYHYVVDCVAGAIVAVAFSSLM